MGCTVLDWNLGLRSARFGRRIVGAAEARALEPAQRAALTGVQSGRCLAIRHHCVCHSLTLAATAPTLGPYLGGSPVSESVAVELGKRISCSTVLSTRKLHVKALPLDHLCNGVCVWECTRARLCVVVPWATRITAIVRGCGGSNHTADGEGGGVGAGV